MSQSPGENINDVDSRTAAIALAELLVSRADALSSNDLATVAEAVTAVRAGARALESSLTARGWGGDVLNGWGLREEEDDEDDWVDDEDDEEEEEDDPAPESAIRMTYQCRADFYLVDECQLASYVLRRAVELGLQGWDQEYLDEHDAFYCFTDLEDLLRTNLEGTGLLPAGGQSTAHRIERTLWDMQDDDASDAAFPLG